MNPSSTAKKATESDVRIRLAEPGDEARILEFLRESMGEGAIPFCPEFWLWKHQQNPFGPSPCAIAEADNAIVGLRVFLMWKWCSQQGVITAVRAVDTATHPAWRGRGIFRRLTMFLLQQVEAQGVTFVFNTPNRQSMPGYLKMGWQQVTRIPVWIRPLRPWRLLRRLWHGQPNVDQGSSQTDRSSIAELLADSRVTSLGRVNDGLGEGYHTPRSSEYLRWRYLNIPHLLYSGRSLFSGDNGAVGIYRARWRGSYQELSINDLFCSANQAGATLAVQLLQELSKESDADYLAACAPRRSWEARALRRAGFIRLPRIGPHFVVRPLKLQVAQPDPCRWSNWRGVLGDWEIF